MNVVKTTLIDSTTGKAFEHVDMLLKNLPKSFAQKPMLNIKNKDWQIINADPMTSDEFARTGKLVLAVRKVFYATLDDSLYTMPTLCASEPSYLEIPMMAEKNLMRLHVDNWRQIEFVSLAHHDSIDHEMLYIRQIYREASVRRGPYVKFREIYARHEIETPLLEGIPLDQLMSFFTSALRGSALRKSALYTYGNFVVTQREQVAEGGFAFDISTVHFYGVQENSLVKFFGLDLTKQMPLEVTKIACALQRIMSVYDLCLVDWCGLRLIPANVEAISEFLLGEVLIPPYRARSLVKKQRT